VFLYRPLGGYGKELLDAISLICKLMFTTLHNDNTVDNRRKSQNCAKF